MKRSEAGGARLCTVYLSLLGSPFQSNERPHEAEEASFRAEVRSECSWVSGGMMEGLFGGQPGTAHGCRHPSDVSAD